MAESVKALQDRISMQIASSHRLIIASGESDLNTLEFIATSRHLIIKSRDQINAVRPRVGKPDILQKRL